VLDPAGSGKTVAQLEVYGDDSADQFGGTRATVYEAGAGGNVNGADSWFAYGIYIPAGFQYPDQWFDLFQNKDSASHPSQALELRGAACGSGTRDHLCYQIRQSGTVMSYYDLGQVQEGHWLYLVAFIQFRTTATGSIKVWTRYDAPPDVSLAPQVDQSNIVTLQASPSRSDIFLYRGASSHTQHQVVDFCGFHRASNPADAEYLPTCPGG
jgi:hypothetical protein